MEAWKFVKLSKAAVVNQVNANADHKLIDPDDVDIVWMHQTEHTTRAILTPIPPNNALYEVTYTDPKNPQISLFSKTKTTNIPL